MLAALESNLNRVAPLYNKAHQLAGVGGVCVQYQSVRNYPRKPRWVPMAKSKTYIVIDLPPPPKLEFEEVNALWDTYRLYNRSLWAFQSGITREHELQLQKEARQVSEEVELDKMFKMNQEENDRVRKVREAALVQEWKQVEQEILETKRKMEDEELAKIEETEKFVKSEIERLKGAIKLEDLDEVIEKALAVETDYNFAVSKDGKYFVGRNNNSETIEGPPPDKPVNKPLDAPN